MNVFSTPVSVAVVGASADPAKWGHWLAKGAAIGRERRRIYLVNRSAAEVAGLQSFSSLQDLPEVPELVAIAVPGPLVLGVIREALALGSRAFLVVAAQMDDEAAAVALLAEYNARMIGPNSLGIYSAEGQLQLMWGGMQAGSLAIISQSGQLGSEIASIGARSGVGVSRFVSLGNQSDVHAAEVLRSLIGDAYTKTVGVYLEDFTGAGEVFAAIRAASEAGLAVILLTTGESVASQQLAHSHTGAMTSELDLVEAACRAAGAVRVKTPAELVQVAAYLDRQPPPGGPRVAIISDSGGQGGIAADVAERFGLEVPELSPTLRSRLQGLLPPGASTRNPIDLAGAGEANLSVYAALPKLLHESGEVDAVVVSGYFGSYGHDTPQLFAAEQTIARNLSRMTGIPILVHAMAPGSEVAQQLRAANVPVVGRIEDALIALAASCALGRPTQIPVRTGTAISGTNQLEVQDALALAGIPFAERRVVRSADEAARAAEDLCQEGNLEGAVVLKAAWLRHKTEAGGVVLGLRDPESTRAAFAAMHRRLGDGEYTLEAQDLRADIAEFIVAVRRDPKFGPVVTVGYGGTETEVWGDVSIELAPVDRSVARNMVERLKSARLLAPWRGRAALDVEALVTVITRLSAAIPEKSAGLSSEGSDPAIQEIELNPVRVGVKGALAVDCLATFETQASEITAAPVRKESE